MAGEPEERRPAPPPTTSQPYGTLIARYRGTEFDAAPPPPPEPPRKARTGFLAFLFVAVAGIALLGAVVVLNLPPGADTSGPAGPTRDPNVTPRVPDSIRVLEAFWQTVRADGLSYHLEATGEAHGAGVEETFTLSLTISGDDYVGTVNTIGGSGMADLVRVDGVVWARPSGGAWRPARTDDEGLRQEPFMGLEGRRELVYDTAVPGATPAEHRLVSTEFYRPSVARMLDLASFRLDADERTLELIVDDEGVPLRATFTSHLAADPTLDLPAFDGTATYTFSDFGIEVEIAAPTP